MSTVRMVPLEELMATRLGGVDPSKFADETFELYSIPAYDSRKPEVVAGEEIGSTKQIVQPRDVLLSKIVPHIRRSWIVDSAGDYRQIASGEWIVFRSDDAAPEYLRHVLLGNDFHAQFMQTVSGVGGSLLRARPAQVAKIRIPLPPFPEQRRIAAILDKADTLRTKRREALAQIDCLAQSIFVEMFGDPATNPKGWKRRRLDELVVEGDSINYGVIQPGDDVENGVPLIRVGDLVTGGIRHEALKRIAPEVERAYQRSRLKGDEILVSCVGSVGVVALASQRERGFNIARAVARIRVGEQANRDFVAAQLSTDAVQRYFTQELRTVSQPTLNIKQIAETQMICPPLEQQHDFATRVGAVRQVRARLKQCESQADAFFESVQHRAFLGTL